MLAFIWNFIVKTLFNEMIRKIASDLTATTPFLNGLVYRFIMNLFAKMDLWQ
jgi:hypothetical protein